MDGDEELIVRIQRACRASPHDEASLCKLMRNPVRTLVDYSGAVVQLQAGRMPKCIIGFNITPSLARALRIAAYSVEGGILLRQAHAHGPLTLDADLLRALPLGPHLRPLVQGHLLVHGHSDAEQASRSVFAFIGIREKNPNKLKRILNVITPSLHHVFFKVYQAYVPAGSALTPAERAICRMLLDGASNKQIASTLQKSEATVRNQLHAIFSKLSVHSRSSAAAILRELLPTRLAPDRARRTASIEHLFY